MRVAANPIMDVGRPKSHTGDYSIKRRLGKGFRNSKKSMMIFSSHKKDEPNESNYEDSLNVTPHRSCSLNALHTGQILLQPRMAQLETLEAKMARIENSLSTTPRKKKISSSSSSITSALMSMNNVSCLNTNTVADSQSTLCDSKANSLRNVSSIAKQLSDSGNSNSGGGGTLIYKTSRDIAREMETLKSALRDKENVIDSLKGQLNTSMNFSRISTTYLQSKRRNDVIYTDKRAAEDRLQRLKHEMDNKTMLIKNIKLELERLDITDNIDVRIQQAELEYQLGREELNLLTVLEEIQCLKRVLDEKDVSCQQNECNLFGFVRKKQNVTLHAAEIVYDQKTPRFGANVLEDGSAMRVEWSTENSGLIRGDLLLEINGKMTLGLKNRDDMARLLSISPNPAQIVVLRHRKNDAVVSTLQEELDVYREKAGEAERIRDSFRSDNVRLTHRISYLEEQVAELLARVPKGNESMARNSPLDEKSDDSRIQIFQKGPKVTLINNPSPRKNMLKTRGNLPIVAQNKTRTSNTSKSTDLLSSKENFSGPGDQSVSTLHDSRRGDSMTRLNTRRPGEIVHCSSPTTNGSKNVENYYNLLQERYIRENRNNNLLSNGTNERTHRLQHFKDDRSCKSADFDSEPNYQSFNRNNNSKIYYDSETSSDYSKTIKYGRPIPPQKPLRLSLHKGCSLQSVKIIDKSNSDIELCKKYARRSQKIDGIVSDDNLGGNKPKEKWC